MPKPGIFACALVATVSICSTAVAAIVGSTWEPIGPTPIHGMFNGGVVGRASAIAVNPTNGNQIWLGTASGGVWYSGDGGHYWSPLTDDQVAPAIGAIALTGCTVAGCTFVLAGTGESAIRRDTFYGRGLLVGLRTALGPPPQYSWTLRSGGPDGNFTLATINDIAANPAGGSDLFVALTSGTTTSGSQTTVTAPEPSPGGYGIYKSVDGGVTFQKLTVPGAAGARPTDLKMDPKDDNVLYAGFLDTGLFKSTDAGATWCPLSGGIAVPRGCPIPTGLPHPDAPPLDWIEIAIWLTDTGNLYVTTGHCPDRFMDRCMPSVYSSNNGGTTWTRVWTGDTEEINAHSRAEGYSRYTHALAIHPTALNTLYLGGVRLWRSSNSGSFFTKDDRNIVGGPAPYGTMLHYDHHQVVFDPTNPGRIYEVNDGGFAARDQINTKWRPGNGWLQIAGYQSISASPLTARVFGGTQDNGGILWASANSWNNTGCCGDSGFTIIDAANPMQMFAAGNYGEPVRSCDGGASWYPVIGALPTYRFESRLFYAPLVQDPSPPHHLYWGGQSLYRGVPSLLCSNVAWTPISPALETGFQENVWLQEDAISAIAIAPSAPGRIYVGYYGGGLYRTDAACVDPSCWTSIGAGLPDNPISRIAVHPLQPDTLLVTLDGWNLDPFGVGTRVWKSTDAGATWAASDSGVPSGVPANVVRYEPGSPDVLWLGLDANPYGPAVYSSADGGATWQPRGGGLPNVPVFDIALDPSRKRAFAGTHGRGAWMLGEAQVIKKELWKSAAMWALPFSGLLLPPDETCSIDIVQEDGTTCASGDVDAMGGDLRTDSTGRLVSTREGYYTDREMAWACHAGTCVGGVPADRCAEPGNSARSLALTCGPDTVEIDLAGPLTISSPPAVQLGVNFADEPGLSAGQGSASSPVAPTNGADNVPFDVNLILRRADGTSQSLCTVRGFAGPGEISDPIVTRLRDAVNASEACAEAGVSARLMTDLTEGGEDDFKRNATLVIEAAGLTGTQIVPLLSMAPGAPSEVCFDLLGLGVPIHDQLQDVSVRLTTGPAGALGGEIRQYRQSELGTSGVNVATTRGMAGDEVAAVLAAALLDPTQPDTDPDRSPRRNLFDVVLSGDTLTTEGSTGVQLCVGDAGIGFRMTADNLANVHPVAVAAVAPATECTSPTGAMVLLDGSSSADPDSSPGTHDDIVDFEWYEDLGLPGQTLLGSGEALSVPLSIGPHAISLRVSDTAGLSDTSTATVSVVDTTPPSVAGIAAPVELYPPHHEMIPVHVDASASDLCGSVSLSLQQAVSSEPDDAPGPADGETIDDVQNVAAGTVDFDVDLRAERDAGGVGRVYSLTYEARDDAGNAATAVVPVAVPLDRDGVTEPLILRLSKSDVGTLVEWTAVPGAHSYNVVRGVLSNFQNLPNGFDLGPAQWVEYGSVDTSTAGDEDAEDPSPTGEVFFYLVEYINTCCPGYSTESAPKPRIVSAPPPPM